MICALNARLASRSIREKPPMSLSVPRGLAEDQRCRRSAPARHPRDTIRRCRFGGGRNDSSINSALTVSERRDRGKCMRVLRAAIVVVILALGGLLVASPASAQVNQLS